MHAAARVRETVMAKRILLVDDEPQIVRLVGRRLRANGYEVLAADNGEMALELAQSEMPDLVILDLMLPKLDGYKVCGLLKRDSRYAQIPIILFTARAQEEDIKIGKEVGANAYITKPFNAQTLLQKIQELVRK